MRPRPKRPVTKVITLLKDMAKQLEKEAKDDEEVYNKMACWCETNDKEKTQAIGDAEVKITDLGNAIQDKTATSAKLDTTITNRKAEVEKHQTALDQATEIRKKELAAFNEEEKDLLESIRALKAAITVLSKHHAEAALLQLPRSDLLSGRPVRRRPQVSHPTRTTRPVVAS